MRDRELEERLQEALQETQVTRRALLRRGLVAGAGLTALPALVAACGGGDEASTGTGTGGGGLTEVPSNGADVSMDDLIAAAKQEGTLNTIALPPDWANYGEIMKTFTSKYGVQIKNANPNGSSAEENQAVKSLKGQDRAPDVLDVSPPAAAEGTNGSLYAAYKNSQWDTIPDDQKDPEGHWVADYWGAISLAANTKVAALPQSWADLKKPEYKGKVALNGDPRESGSAFAGVLAAAVANGGSLDDVQPGIDFFKELKGMGNFILVDATPATVANGQTPVTIDWDYLQIAYGSEFKSNITWEVTVPADAVVGNFYCQAINVNAPHPFAARLWQEFLYSDEGQLLWLKGYSHPARFQDMSDRDVIPQDLLDKLPSADLYTDVEFPTPEQTEKATQVITDGWSAVAG
jgi:putative spermidine/putrescine transport system substrate-binding protein